MGPVSLTIMRAGLQVLQWLLWGTAGLLLVLVVTQSIRGDSDAVPGTNLMLAGFFAVAGTACWYARRFFNEPQ